MHPLLRLAPLFGPQRALLALSIAGLLAGTALSLLGPWLVAHAIDVDIGARDQPGLARTAAAYFVVVLANLAVLYASRVGLERAAQGAMRRLKEQLFDHLVSHDLAFHDAHPSGRLITRVQGDTQALQVLFAEVVLSAPADLLLIVGMFGLLWHRSPTIAGLVFAVTPPYAIALLAFRRWSPPRFLAAREVSAKLTGFIAEHLRAMPTLQLFDREAWVRDRAREINQEAYRKDLYANLIPTLFFNSVFLVRSLGFATVLWGGAHLVSRGLVTVGVLVMGLGYLRQMFNPLMRISNHLTTVERARASAIRIAAILDRAPTIVDPPHPVPWRGLGEGVRLEGVAFAYAPGTPILRGVDLHVPAGARIGIVGATGSGKSTLVNLLLRFRDPDAGRVTLGGVDLRHLSLTDLRAHVGLVLQDVHLFEGTVLENLGGDDVLARLACDRIALEIPLDAQIAIEGRNLSRGERQLLTFARALVHDPELLVLDEATSAVDPATEVRIQAALERLSRGRTTVIVAHRLATVRDCDRIIVMAQGAIVESGTHAELLARQGVYAALYELQYGEAA
jgi:ATP-binding cassette subfamily B protein